MTQFHRKLYAFLQSSSAMSPWVTRLTCLQSSLGELESWWEQYGDLLQAIASSSDRVNLASATGQQAEICHPLSGATQPCPANSSQAIALPNAIQASTSVEEVFWWLWRFGPDQQVKQHRSALLSPAHTVLPDSPIPSYQSTVSALTGAMFSDSWQPEQPAEHPYLLLFTFSPVQEFIKASRKFLDFWSGSFMLHYLSARLCEQIAQRYGPDSVITPSLWGQDIIDALLVQRYPDFAADFPQGSPTEQFLARTSRSLSTAGFPNTIVALLPGKDAAIDMGAALSQTLTDQWYEIAVAVREDIKTKVRAAVAGDGCDRLAALVINPNDDAEHQERDRRELRQLQQPGCWEWNALWDAQIQQTWEPYFVALPLGNPDSLAPQIAAHHPDIKIWLAQQQQVAQSASEIPTLAERHAYQSLNIGTWWGSCQGRLGRLIPAIKNTRNWHIPVAPGGRSTLSGQSSALHPRFNYAKFKQGRGMSPHSLRLFWRVMHRVYPQLFNGSEQLNALELTKRMAWKHGGVAAQLGLDLADDDYENLIRFPNLCSIAAARFASDHPDRVVAYRQSLRAKLQHHLPAVHASYCSRTNRPFQIQPVDQVLAPHSDGQKGYNGVMFSSKWLAEDLDFSDNPGDRAVLRQLVNDTHREQGFQDSSPADWWVLVLGDGDSMGAYVSGRKLKPYRDYLATGLQKPDPCSSADWENLQATPKRMGPATHIGLNRALLDFSNRLVPYLTEQRCCGKVIYSGGDDVMAVLPLADLPIYLRSLRAAWSGQPDPEQEFTTHGDYWYPTAATAQAQNGIPDRPLFTMGQEATLSLGIIIAAKSVPLPTVLEQVWEAEKSRAKKLPGGQINDSDSSPYPPKDGLCFRVIYGSGNTLEALMKGHLLNDWVTIVQASTDLDLSPLLYRLADELLRHAAITQGDRLLEQIARVVFQRRDQVVPNDLQTHILHWLHQWETWAYTAQTHSVQTTRQPSTPLGTTISDLANLLKFTAFWMSRSRQEQAWTSPLGVQPS